MSRRLVHLVRVTTRVRGEKVSQLSKWFEMMPLALIYCCQLTEMGFVAEIQGATIEASDWREFEPG